ncbi:hypothetical protein [Comamonas antarctica]|uniref:hypothetical protein n=1 Tax=Comamonas antarctica TaxID=2743470 RepID=UPI0028E90F2F|nr:hypothetical protein [Comamonas antarctica]
MNTPAAQVGDRWYRYEDVAYASPLDEYDRPTGPGQLRVHCREYEVVKVTPCGVRLDIGRYVSASSRKRFAHATKEDAKNSFILRKSAQLRIYSARCARAEQAIRLVTGGSF